MIEAFEKLSKEGLISEEIRTEISNAWNGKLQEAREQVASELREEFANRYAHDKGVMIEALDKLVTDRLTHELTEFAQDRKVLDEKKAQLDEAIKKSGQIMENFVIKSLARELAEFQKDRKTVAENFTKLEHFVIRALANEIREFADDKRQAAETKDKLVKEAKEQFQKVKKEFVRRSAKAVESVVTKNLTREITQLREDIDQSRQNDFGRRLYEAFAQEYSLSVFNENNQSKKLTKQIEAQKAELAEARRALESKTKLVESAQREVTRVREQTTRQKILGELLAPLGADKRTVMNSLLESVSTSDLNKKFEYYLPAVLEGEKPQRQAKVALSESTAVTGDRKAPQQQAGDNTILDIRKLAGLN